LNPDWVIGAAALTIFVEGSINDRQEILYPSPPKTPAEVEDIVKKHPLVQHHGLSPACLDLVRAHQMVESGHRHDAYGMILTHAGGTTHQQNVLTILKKTLDLWRHYRDGVARACGLRNTAYRAKK
jgi:pyrroloquinoline quinone (PQQ) biosynthesis protein C